MCTLLLKQELLRAEQHTYGTPFTDRLWSSGLAAALVNSRAVIPWQARLRLCAQELPRAEQPVEAGLWDKGRHLMRAGCGHLWSSGLSPVIFKSCVVNLRLYVQELLRAEQSMEAGLWDKGGNIMRAGCRGLSKLQAKEGSCDSLLEDLQALEARCTPSQPTQATAHSNHHYAA